MLLDEKKFSFKIDYYYKDNKTFLGIAPEGINQLTSNFTFRTPRWGEARKILSAAVSFKNGNIEINPFSLSDAQLKYLIVDWDLTDNKGKKIPITEQNIDALDPILIKGVNSVLNENKDISDILNSLSSI